MRRKMELVRILLLGIEAGTEFPDAIDRQVVIGHLALMIDGGLIEARYDDDGESLSHCCHLAWAGCEFLDMARDERIWTRAMERVNKAGLKTVDFATLTHLLTELVTEELERAA